MRYLPSAKIQRFRLALATKPYDIFFLAHVPTRNTDNPWNATNIAGLRPGEDAMGAGVEPQGGERRRLQDRVARDPDAFPEPKWPTQSLDELIERTFAGRMIDERRRIPACCA